MSGEVLADIRYIRRLLFHRATLDEVMAETGVSREVACEIWWAIKRFPLDYEALDHLEQVRWAQKNRLPLVNGHPYFEAEGRGALANRWIPDLGALNTKAGPRDPQSGS